MYLEYHNDGHFEAATGTLQLDDTKGIVEYQSCMWIEDTGDGGASDWITSIDEKNIKKWTQEAHESDEIPLDHYRTPTKTIKAAEKPIYAHCHCKGVEFWIQPPTPASKKAHADLPELLTQDNLESDASQNNENASCWWLCNDSTRFLAGTCACLSCRRASGFDITFWAFVPTANIFLDADLTKPFPLYNAESQNQYWGTINTYHSSEGVTRSFCGRCGANVFWDGEEKRREGLVDVAVGLLDAESGARSEELLSWWTEYVSFEEFAMNKDLIRALSEGLKVWGGREGADG